jgi:uncharacterized membrane protein
MTNPSETQVVRKAGRGFRPFLLIPKVLAMAVYFGTIFSTVIMWLVQIGCRDMTNLNLSTVMTQVMMIRSMIVYVAVPALLLTLILGVLLLLQHPKPFLKLRWIRVKLLLVGVGVPVFHVFMASRLYHFRQLVLSGTIDASLRTQLSLGFVLLLIWSMLVIWLGRHKPRLGQNWAQSFRSIK